LSWEVRLAAHAQKEFNSIHGPDRARIHSGFLILELNARPFGAIPLKDSPFYRLRVGDWRVIYEIIDERGVVRILRILRRSEKTYRGF